MSALRIGTCVEVNEELPYMRFPREQNMRTGRKPRAATPRGQSPTLLSQGFFPAGALLFVRIIHSLVNGGLTKIQPNGPYGRP